MTTPVASLATAHAHHLAAVTWLPSASMVVCCAALLVLTTGFHLEVLRACDRLLRSPGAFLRRLRPMVLLLAIATAHVVEVLAYAVAFGLLARHGSLGTLGGSGAPPFSAALYFSLETFSSLGYGDLLPTGALRLMAGSEAVNGLLLIGWSACYPHAPPDVALRPDSKDQPQSSDSTAGTRCSRRRVR